MENDMTPPMGGTMGGFGAPAIDFHDLFAGLGQGGWFGAPFAGGFPGRPGGIPGGPGGADDVAATFAEDALGDFSDDGAAPTDIGALEVGTTVVTATHQGEPRDIDYVTFTVPEGTELSGLTVEGYEAEPGNLAFFGIEAGATFATSPDTADASTLLGGVTYAHWAVGVDVLQIAGDLEGAQGFEGPLGPGDYTLWLNQTGPANTVSIGLELTEIGDGGDDAGDPPGSGDGLPVGGGMPALPPGLGDFDFGGQIPDDFDFAWPGDDVDFAALFEEVFADLGDANPFAGGIPSNLPLDLGGDGPMGPPDDFVLV